MITISVIFKNKQLVIQDLSGKELLYADADKFRLNLNNMDITGWLISLVFFLFLFLLF